jgi:hypothetical protein
MSCAPLKGHMCVGHHDVKNCCWNGVRSGKSPNPPAPYTCGKPVLFVTRYVLRNGHLVVPVLNAQQYLLNKCRAKQTGRTSASCRQQPISPKCDISRAAMESASVTKLYNGEPADYSAKKIQFLIFKHCPERCNLSSITQLRNQRTSFGKGLAIHNEIMPLPIKCYIWIPHIADVQHGAGRQLGYAREAQSPVSELSPDVMFRCIDPLCHRLDDLYIKAIRCPCLSIPFPLFDIYDALYGLLVKVYVCMNR